VFVIIIMFIYMCMVCLLATNHSSRSVNPDVSRSSHVGIKGPSGHGNSGETFDARSADVEMPDTRDCGANDLYFQQGTSTPNHTFTITKEIKYAQRYEEGYDLPDAHYEMWLRFNHPEINVLSDSRLQLLTLHYYLKLEKFSKSKFLLHQFKCQTLIRVLKHHLFLCKGHLWLMY